MCFRHKNSNHSHHHHHYSHHKYSHSHSHSHIHKDSSSSSSSRSRSRSRSKRHNHDSSYSNNRLAPKKTAVSNILKNITRTNERVSRNQEKGSKEKLEKLEQNVLKERDNEIKLSLYFYYEIYVI